MRERLLEILACPRCRSVLRPSGIEWRGGEIDSGLLACGDCATVYPIARGVPRFEGPVARSADARSAEHFEKEFTAESSGDIDFDDEAVLEFNFFTRTGIDSAIYEHAGDDFARTRLRLPQRGKSTTVEHRFRIEAVLRIDFAIANRYEASMTIATTSSARILIADDHPLFRTAMREGTLVGTADGAAYGLGDHDVGHGFS